MKKLLLLLVLCALVANAQTRLQVRRGTTASLPTGLAGEPLFTTDSLDLYMGSDSGNTLIGGRSVLYGKALFAKDAGSTDAYAITLVPAPTKYWQGMRLALRVNTANAGTATLNVNSLGAKTIYKTTSDVLETGDLYGGDVAEVVFVDSAFYLINPRAEVILSAILPQYNLIVVPREPLPNNTAVSWGVADSGIVSVYAFNLADSAKFIGIGVTGGTSGGSATIRAFNAAIYDSGGTCLSQGASAGNPGASTHAITGLRGQPRSGTQDTLEIAPGLYYVGFATVTDVSGTNVYRGPDISGNAFGAFIYDSEMAGGKFWAATATNRAVGDGTGALTMPATLGALAQATSGFDFPWCVLVPLGIGPSSQ